MKEAILRVWKDPVWSKVIAGGILALCAVIYTVTQSRIRDISFFESFLQIVNSGISFKTILIVGGGFFLFRYLYKKYWVQSKPEYSEDEKSMDVALLKKLKTQTRPSESSISINKTNNLVRDFSPPKLRRMEGNKSVLIIFAIIILLGSGYKFYSDPRPRYMPFYTTYDFLHGNVFYFEQDTLYYDELEFTPDNYRFYIHQIEFNTNYTNIHLHGYVAHGGIASGSGPGPGPGVVGEPIDTDTTAGKIRGFLPEKDTTSGTSDAELLEMDTVFNDYNIFYSLQIGTLFRTRLDDYEHFVILQQGQGFVHGILKYPSYVGKEERIVLWKNGSPDKGENALEIITMISNVPEGKGSPVWGILFLLGIPLLIYSIKLNPFGNVRVGLTYAGREIRYAMEYDLERFLKIKGANSYENLSSMDKRKYNNIIKYYKEIESQILK